MRLLHTTACSFTLAFSIKAQSFNIGKAATFAILGASAVMNADYSVILGDVGVSPGTTVTGFPPGILSGKLYYNNGTSVLAHSDAQAAYNTAAGMTATTPLTGQDLGGRTLTPGVYLFSSSAQLTGTLTLNAQGNPHALFVFQIGSTLVTAINSSVKLIHSSQACNVIWQVGSSATLGGGTSFAGVILAHTSITVTAGVSSSGSMIALAGTVTLSKNMIDVCNTCSNTPASAPAS